MKAIDLKKPGAVHEMIYTDLPAPQAGNGQVLIRVKAAGVNRPDILQREGNYPAPQGASKILGLEVAGVIEETGEEVCALLQGGGYAEYAVADHCLCLPLPKGLSFEEAAALPEGVFTVWNNVFVLGEFKKGETVLVHGGTSGIGTTAIQMIKAFGGSVIATCGTDEKCDAAEKLGAALAINYKTRDFTEEVTRFTDGKGADLVLDMVGGDYIRRNIDCMAEGGRHVSIAFLNGAKSEIIIPAIMKKRIVMTGSMLRPRPLEEKAALAGDIKTRVWPLIENGKIRPQIDNVYELKEAAKAHERMESGAHIGKIILQI